MRPEQEAAPGPGARGSAPAARGSAPAVVARALAAPRVGRAPLPPLPRPRLRSVVDREIHVAEIELVLERLVVEAQARRRLVGNDRVLARRLLRRRRLRRGLLGVCFLLGRRLRGRPRRAGLLRWCRGARLGTDDGGGRLAPRPWAGPRPPPRGNPARPGASAGRTPRPRGASARRPSAPCWRFSSRCSRIASSRIPIALSGERLTPEPGSSHAFRAGPRARPCAGAQAGFVGSACLDPAPDRPEAARRRHPVLPGPLRLVQRRVGGSDQRSRRCRPSRASRPPRRWR